MAYTPELSRQSSCTLRRIAWALDVPMTVAIEMVFEAMPRLLDQLRICEACKDKAKCHDCTFNRLNRKEV